MSGLKDPLTEVLRQQIVSEADYLIETDRAEVLLDTLSFQSLVKPERHVWFDTGTGETGDGITVELEDWTFEGTWDNSVAAIDTDDPQKAIEISRAWLRGDDLDSCLSRCAGCRVERKRE